MPDYDRYVAEVAGAAPDQNYDAARLLRVTMQLAKQDNGGELSMDHAAKLRDAVLRYKPNAPTQNVPEVPGAAGAFAESAYRRGVVSPVAALMARASGDEYKQAFQENTNRVGQLETEYPWAAGAGSMTGSMAAPLVGAAGGLALSGGNPLGAVAGGVAGGLPGTVAGDLEREQAGRGTTNRALNAGVETLVNAIPGVGVATGVASRLGGKFTARAIGSGVEGAAMGGSQNAAQQGVDLYTGDRENFDLAELGKATALGGVAGSVVHPVTEVMGKFNQPKRVVNMDQLAQQFEQPVDRGFDPVPSPYDSGVVVPTSKTEVDVAARLNRQNDIEAERAALARREFAREEGAIDSRIRMSQREGVGIPQEQLIREKLLAQQKENDAVADLNNEAAYARIPNVLRDTTAAADLGMLPDVPRLGTPESLTSQDLGVAEKPRATVDDVTNAHTSLVDTINTSADNLQLSAPVKQALLTKAKQWKANQIEEARNGRLWKVTWPKSVVYELMTPTERNVQKETQSQQERLAAQAQPRTAPMQESAPVVEPTPEVPAAVPENIAFEPPKPIEAPAVKAPSEGRLAWEQRKAERAAQRAAVKANLQQQKGVTNGQEVQSQGQAEASPVLNESPVAPEPAKPRMFFKNDLDKLTEITDRVDPKYYKDAEQIPYDSLTDDQKKNADKVAQRSRVTEQRLYAGVPFNLKDIDNVLGISDAAKHVGKMAKAAGEYIGVDAIDRAKMSNSEAVRGVGEKLSEAVHLSKSVTADLHTDVTKARKLAATINPKEALELRKVSGPPTSGAAGKSQLLNMLEGRAPASGYLARVKDAFTGVNKATFDILKKNNVAFFDNGKAGKDVVVRHFTNDAMRAFQGYDTTAMKNFADWMAANNKKPDGSEYTPDEILKHFAHTTDEATNAYVRLDPLEIGRQFPRMPDWVQGQNGWTKMLDLDPESYIRRVASSAVNRAGFARAFGANTKMSDILNQFTTNTKADAGEVAALKRALDAYNGISEVQMLSDAKGFSAHLKNIKQVYAALLTSAGAAVDATETAAVASLVPLRYSITGVAEAALNPKRAGREGGIEADIKTLNDLTSDARAVAGNVRGFLHRLTLRNAVNRANHVIAYEAGRAWGMSLLKNGASNTDEAFLRMNRVPENVIEKFRSGYADPSEAITLGVTVAQNLSGRKANRAEQSRASRNDIINAYGPIFRQYGENRVRNLVRASDNIVKEIRSGNINSAAQMIVSQLVGVGGSALAATAVAQVLRYGIEGLQMAWESGDQLVPFLANFVGGGVTGTLIQAQDQARPVERIVGALSWLPSLGSTLYQTVTDPAKAVTRTVPVINRIESWVNESGPGQKAYRVFREKEADIFGAPPSGAAESPFKEVRSNLRKAMFSNDKEAVTTAMREATRAVYKSAQEKGVKPEQAMRDFIRNTMLLKRHMPDMSKGATPRDMQRAKQFKELRDAMGPTAFAEIRAYELRLQQWLATYERKR